MHTISKQFDFCYGHRVWSQTLRKGYATDEKLSCRHLHGHQGKVTVFLESVDLTAGMVTDFKHLGWFKKWLDDTLDHKMILDLNDPILKHELGEHHERILKELTETEHGYWYVTKPETFLDEAVTEKMQGLILVNFVPTSENICKWLYQIVQRHMNGLKIRVSRIEFNETPKSMAAYCPSI